MKKDIANISKKNKCIIIATSIILIFAAIFLSQTPRSEDRISILNVSNNYNSGTTLGVSQNKTMSIRLPDEFKKLAFEYAAAKKAASEAAELAKTAMEEAKDTQAALIAKVEKIEDIKSFVKNNDKETVYNAIMGTDDSEKIYLPEVDVTVNVSNIKTKNVQLPVAYLSQLPELPTGCEITSLTTVLNYFEYNVDKCTMADRYLPKCSLGEGSFWDYFLGDPRDPYSFGCYASPIVTAANSYLATQGNQHKAYNFSNSSFSTLLQQIEAGFPVVLWSTMDLSEAYMTMQWDVNGETIQWTAPEHCVVMIGYDLNAKTVTISDPMCGMVIRDLETMAKRYEQMPQSSCCNKAYPKSNRTNY
ncbi:C39 family peptidase [[Clostridium] fimetarium]|uniref:Uncharacterized protein YvpB n=1 Tax=[Clostridium] fimetarium TaxID=99656 RepID=A0A1I0R5X5_9FIRM|nr:C39 family peptidase [[Clostridium] fimetarium]SEW35942.1 Uncharacterized protein YvpB [[Clostridium] fimetarium]